MKKTSKLISSIWTASIVVLLTVMCVSALTGFASAAPSGCYIRTQGTSENNTQTRSTACPVTGSDTAARYSSGCWLSTGGTFSSVDCNSISIGVTGTPEAANGGVGVGSGSSVSEGDGTFSSPLANSNNRGQCGKGETTIRTGLDLGCVGEDFEGTQLNPIVDMGFALFRFLSAGVGLIVIGSIIVAGIQYSASRGNPQATQAAIGRVSNSITALLLYLFIFSIANYLVPGGMFL